VGKQQRRGVDHRHIADPHAGTGLVAVLRPDVDVEVLELGDLLAVLVLEQMDRLTRDDAGNGAVASLEGDPLADQHDGIPTSHLPEAQIAVVVDVRDVEADLVDVADDGERGAAGGAGDAGER